MLQVRLLGQFDVRVDGARVVIPSRAGQSLLAYLLLSAGTAHRRERLAGLLWPDTSDDNARRNLRQELWRVRKAIGSQRAPNGEYIQAEEFTVAFNSETDYWLDVAQLDRPVATEDALSDLMYQLALYRGELLPGFYDDWIVLERERVQALFENKMTQLMEALCREQRWSTVLEWGERWIALGHTPEPAYRALMMAYVALGDRSKAAATFERCRAALEQELGVEPSPDTRAMYEQLLDESGRVKTDSLAGLRPSSPNFQPSAFSSQPLRTEVPPAPGEPPFKGLQYFDETDADLFFGRELLTAKLVQLMRESKCLAVIVGASGSGKSSLVRAGLIPALKKAEPLADGILPPEGSSAWRFEVITPTAHPLTALAIALTREIESVTATATLIDDLARDPRSLSLYLQRAAHGSDISRCLLVVDQFEELFTLCHDEFEREAFIDNLLTTLTPLPRSPAQRLEPREESGRRDGGAGLVTLILTIRADFYAHLAQYPELREAVAQHQVYIGPMTVDELRRAIEEPAQRRGYDFQPGLVDLILRDVGDEPGALPLVSHALLETWKRRSGRALTLKGYAEAGGARGAIAYTAETVYQQLSAGQQASARSIFLRLTELGEGTEDTRRRATITELVTQPGQADQVRAVLNILADARLITTGEDSAEVAHEALIREWPRLREWLNVDREGLQLHRHLTEAAYDWELLDRDPGELYRGARLAQAAEWAAANAHALNRSEQAFLDASRELEQHEARERETQQQRELDAARRLAEEQQRRANEQSQYAKQLRRRAMFLAGALISAIVMASAALFFSEQARQSAVDAQTASRLATSRELAAAALSNLSVDPERSILLALQAVSMTYPVDQTVLPEAEDALHRAVLASRALLTLCCHADSVVTAAYSPDGTRVATASQDGTAKVWDTATGKELMTLGEVNKSNAVNLLAYSPDGTRLVTAHDDHTAKVWDLATRRVILTLSGHDNYVISVVYSPDGAHIATTSGDDSVKMWDAATGKELYTLSEGEHAAGHVAFSPDGKRFATAGGDNTARMWDVATGREMVKFSGHTDAVNKVAFNPAGTRIATVSADNTARVWDSTTGTQQLLLNLPASGLGVAFSPDGKWLATSGFDGTAAVWDAASGKELLTLLGHSSAIYDVSFSPDGTRLASAGRDSTAKVWDITPSRELLTFMAADPRGTVSSLAYSPDGTRLVTASDDKARLWDAETGELLLTLPGHSSDISRIGFSPDGTRLVTTSDDKTVKVWDAATGKDLLTLTGHTARVVGAAFSPDGKRLATASEDGTARIWAVDTGRELLTVSWFNEIVTDIAFSPDGEHIATAGFPKSGDVSLRTILWDAATGRQLFALSSPGKLPSAIAFSPDGKQLALGYVDGSMKVYGLSPDGLHAAELFTPRGHRGWIEDLVYSLDGKRFATASYDGSTKIWDAATGQELLTLLGHEGGVFGAALSQDDTRLATGGRDGTVRIYLLQVEDLVALAQSRLTRSWRTDECQKYLHVDECLE